MSRAQLHHLYSPFLMFNSCSALLCTARFQDNLGILQYVRTRPKCSVARTLFSHVCRFPTHPFELDCWCLLRAPLLSHSTDCKHTDSRIANVPSKHTLFARLPLSRRHRFIVDVCCVLLAVAFHGLQTHRFQNCKSQAVTFQFIGAVKLADKNSSHTPHVQFGSIL